MPLVASHAAGIGAYYIFANPITSTTATTSGAASSSAYVPPPAYVPRTPPAGFDEYHNLTYHLSLFYPNTLTVKEYAQAGTAMTVTFEATDGSNDGFQIFIVPYGESQITPDRLKQDIPSGVIEQQTNIVIDGKPAIMFYSTNATLGDTREVWFINHGFLYEVTTYKQLDTWLASIMQTWQFIQD